MKRHLKYLAGILTVIFLLTGSCFVVFGEETSSTGDATSSIADNTGSGGGPSSISGDTSSENTSSGDTGSENTSSGDTSSENTSSGDTSSENTSSGDTSSENTSSGDTSSENTSSGDTSSENTSSGDTSSEPIPDEFLVTVDGIDITRSFQKNGARITGQVSHIIKEITIKLSESGVSETVTFTLEEADGEPVANGTRFTFDMQLVHTIGTQSITQYYYISVTRLADPSLVSSNVSSDVSSDVSSENTSSAPSSEVPSQPSSAPMQSEPENDSSSNGGGIIGSASSSATTSAPTGSSSSQTGDNGSGGFSWLLPVAIILILIGVAGIFYVVWEILKMRGIIKPSTEEQPEVDAVPDGFVDLLTASQGKMPDTEAVEETDSKKEPEQIDLDAFFKDSK